MSWIGHTFLPAVEDVFGPGEKVTGPELVRRLSRRGLKKEAQFASGLDDVQLEDLIKLLPES